MTSDSFVPNANGAAPTASTFESCRRRCEAHGIGASNKNTGDARSVAWIYRVPDQDLPPKLRDGWRYAVEHANNIRNRPTKVRKFASSNSEDKVTWAVFESLRRAGRLGAACRRLGLVRPDLDLEPTILLWGSAVKAGDQEADDESARLRAVCDGLKEQGRSRTEPDVALMFGDAALVVFEAKYRGRNETKKASYSGWNRYRTADGFLVKSGFGTAVKTGRYELTRNWAVGLRWAKGRAFTLVNLGPPRLFTKNERAILDAFAKCLAPAARTPTSGAPTSTVSATFRTLTWRELIASESFDPDVETYLQARGLR